jgi:hypothetical protein
MGMQDKARGPHFGGRRGLVGGRKILAAAALVASSSVPLVVSATEGGLSHYLPGGIATLIDLAPTKPGWVVEPMYLHYGGKTSASTTIPIAGTVTGGLHADSDALLLGGLYTLNQTVLGAHYSFGAYLPYVWIDAKAEVSSALGTLMRRDSTSGVGDMLLFPAMLGWKSGFWQINALLPIYAPTSEYKVGRLANTGLNYWTFDPIAGVSYNNEEIGFNAALHTGIVVNTQNPDTDYHSGSIFHLEGSMQQLLPAGPGFLGIGAETFYLQQVTADSGAGAKFGSFEGRTVGVGPVLTYVLPRGEKQTLVAEFRWLPEVEVQRRMKGDYFWLKLVYQF